MITKRCKKYILFIFSQDFETLNFILKQFRKEIVNTIDGCISNTPPKTDLLSIYGENMTNTYLLIIQHFWANHYESIDSPNILKMSTYLFKFSEKLKKLKVNEPNLIKNGKELVKIYMKKTYKNITDVIENILKSEREVKAVKSENGELTTNGPNDLFDILSKSFNLIQDSKIKYIHSKMLNMFYECIIQYLIGVDCLISNYNILVDRDFLIAVANNSVVVNMLLNSLIDNFKEVDVLGEKEINEEIRTKEIMSSLNLMSQNSVSRFVTDMSKKLAESFDCNYLLLNLRKILLVTQDVYSELNPLMNGMIKKKCWEEVLKLTVFYYIKLLLTTAHKKVKKVEEITTKLEDDKGLLKETYSSIVGENLTNANLKILDDILDFLQISSYMIPSSCHTLREYLGPSFNMSTVKALVVLRCDFSKEEKKEALNLCKEVLEKYQDKKGNRSGGFFDKMQKEIKIENDELDDQDLQDVNEIDEEEKRKEEETNVMDIEAFLANEDGEEEEEEEDDKKEETTEEKEEEQISDVIYEGVMKKKSYTVWQERFFQLKNGYLYWFKDKTSSTSQNKLSIQSTMKVESHKDCKFLMVVEDKNDTKHGGKVYKFSVETEEEKEKWINAITSEMKRLKGEIDKKDDVLLVIKPKKKIIDDFYKLPEVGNERTAIKIRIINSIQKEPYFKFKQIAYTNSSTEASKDKHKSKNNNEQNNNLGDLNNENNINLMQEGTLQQFEIGFDDAKDSNQNKGIFSCCKSCWDGFLGLFASDSQPRNYKDAKEKLNPDH